MSSVWAHLPSELILEIAVYAFRNSRRDVQNLSKLSRYFRNLLREPKNVCFLLARGCETNILIALGKCHGWYLVNEVLSQVLDYVQTHDANPLNVRKIGTPWAINYLLYFANQASPGLAQRIQFPNMGPAWKPTKPRWLCTPDLDAEQVRALGIPLETLVHGRHRLASNMDKVLAVLWEAFGTTTARASEVVHLLRISAFHPTDVLREYLDQCDCDRQRLCEAIETHYYYEVDDYDAADALFFPLFPDLSERLFDLRFRKATFNRSGRLNLFASICEHLAGAGRTKGSQNEQWWRQRYRRVIKEGFLDGCLSTEEGDPFPIMTHLGPLKEADVRMAIVRMKITPWQYLDQMRFSAVNCRWTVANLPEPLLENSVFITYFLRTVKIRFSDLLIWRSNIEELLQAHFDCVRALLPPVSSLSQIVSNDVRLAVEELARRYPCFSHLIETILRLNAPLPPVPRVHRMNKRPSEAETLDEQWLSRPVRLKRN